MVSTGGVDIAVWDTSSSLERSRTTSENATSGGPDEWLDPVRPRSVSVADDMAPKSRRDPRLRGLGRGLVPPVIDDDDVRNFWHTKILKARTGTVFGRLSIKF